MSKLQFIFIVLALLLGTGTDQAFAQDIVIFGPGETRIEGAIPYSVIGKYKAQFRVFKGRIALDGISKRVQSVYLEIDASSIRSNCPWCDKIARSRRLLFTTRYPKIVFKSDKIIHDESGYKVRGILEMRGVKRTMIFPFKVERIIDQKTKLETLDLKGSWVINRKNFNIIWNRVLDRGGIIVGDNFTVDWGIKVKLN